MTICWPRGIRTERPTCVRRQDCSLSEILERERETLVRRPQRVQSGRSAICVLRKYRQARQAPITQYRVQSRSDNTQTPTDFELRRNNILLADQQRAILFSASPFPVARLSARVPVDRGLSAERMERSNLAWRSISHHAYPEQLGKIGEG